MPDLARINTHFGTPCLKLDGTIVRGVLRPAQDVRATFHGLLYPRSMLIVDPAQPVSAGDAIIDPQGNTFLCGAWSESRMGKVLVGRQFVLFYAPYMTKWQRGTTTTEPISGLPVSGAVQLLGQFPALKEPVSRAKDEERVQIDLTRVVMGVPLQLGDFVDGARVQRVEPMLGLTYAEAYT